MAWVRERCSSWNIHCHLWQVRELSPRVTKVGELATSFLPAAAHRRGGPCTLPGQHTGADLVVRVTDEPALKAKEQERWLSPHSTHRTHIPPRVIGTEGSTHCLGKKVELALV